MLRTSLRSLWSHKRRLISTCIAVVLGVAFMSGTLVLTGTINRAFDALFDTGFAGVDAVVRGPVLFDDQQSGTQRELLPEATADQVADVSGVASAAGTLSTSSITLLDAKGEAMGGAGPPTLVGNWYDDGTLNPFRISEGRAPADDDEAVIDKATFEKGKFKVGSSIHLVTADGDQALKLVGVVRFGESDSAGGVINVLTTLPEVQALTGETGRINDVQVRAEVGVTPEALVQRIEAAKVAEKVDVVTGEQAAAEQSQELKGGFVSFFSTILTVFAAISLFVGAFIISNTFGILVAQRTRELALFRAIGASRRQVLGSVLLEAAAVGVFSALIGFVAGIGLAAAALWALAQIGLDLPSVGIAISPGAAIFTVLVGLGITSAAALLPAIRATRVPPLAALRDVAVDRSNASKVRLACGLLALVLGALSIVPAFGADPTTDRLPGIGLGLALLVVAVLVLGPTYAKALASLVGTPVAALRGITGRLSRQNAMRSPRRTASTASALVIGVTLIVFITVFAASAQRSISDSISGGFRGEYIVQPVSQGTFTGVSPEIADRFAAVDGVSEVAAASFTIAQVTLPDGSKPGTAVAGIDPASYGDIFDVQMDRGKLTDLRTGTIVVDRQVAEKHDLAIGSKLQVVSASGRKGSYAVAAISDEPALLGQYTLLDTDADALNAKPTVAFLGIKLDRGTSVEEIRPALQKVTDDYPTVKLQDEDQFTGSIVDQITVLLNVIYGLLALSMIIAIIGIYNTLSLSIHERTRELGLLRAMGMSRSQLRSSVRWEAAIVAVLGTLVGTVVGLGASYTMVRALKSQGFTSFEVPVFGALSLITIVVIALALGVLAAVLPARKAAKLDVLQAIAAE